MDNSFKNWPTRCKGQTLTGKRRKNRVFLLMFNEFLILVFGPISQGESMELNIVELKLHIKDLVLKDYTNCKYF